MTALISLLTTITVLSTSSVLVKTDSIFYRIMQTVPGILFELLGEPAEVAQGYEFRSVEIKQLAFRIDGVFLPKPNSVNQTVCFVEVQFQDDSRFYQRFFGEIFLFLAQHPETVNWRAVVLFSNRRIEPKPALVYDVLLESRKVQRVYLEDFVQSEPESLGIGLIRLIVSKPTAKVVEQAQSLILQAQRSPRADLENQVIIELIETIMVYKFPKLSRKEIERMFGLSELRQTRVYQDALEEGREEGRQAALKEGEMQGQLKEGRSFVLRLLKCRIGEIAPEAESKIETLSLIQLELLGEALLDFEKSSDLNRWLSAQ